MWLQLVSSICPDGPANFYWQAVQRASGRLDGVHACWTLDSWTPGLRVQAY